MRRAFAALLLFAFAAGAHAEAPARFGVFVGFNGDKADERPQLRYADDDAARLFDQLSGGLAGAWLLTTFDTESARARGLATEDAATPTTTELARVLGEVFWKIRAARAKGKKTELIFFFAGHGDVDPGGEGYLVFADGKFTRSALAAQLVEASPADLNHVWVDACASYFMVSRSGSGAAPVELTGEMLTAARAGKRDAAAWSRTGVFVSTSDGQKVHESPELSAGVFSFLLRSALSGAADADGDGVVEYGEAAAFVAAATASAEDKRMKLEVFAQAPRQRPHAPLVSVLESGAESFLVLDEGKPHKLRVLGATGAPMLEVHRAPGETALIALAGSPFFIVQDEDREAVLVPRGRGAYALSSLDWSPAPEARGAPTPDPRRLFARPYSRAFVDGYLDQSSLVPPERRGALAFEWAPRGRPPFRIPWAGLATGAWVTGGALLAGAAGCAVGNASSFAALESRFRETGTLDPDLALTTDAWMTGAVALGVSAAAVLAGAAGMSLAALEDE